jgi:hypothetical protein
MLYAKFFEDILGRLDPSCFEVRVSLADAFHRLPIILALPIEGCGEKRGRG